MANMELSAYVISESYAQSHNDRLNFSKEEVVCILSVVMKMLQMPSSLLLSLSLALVCVVPGGSAPALHLCF